MMGERFYAVISLDRWACYSTAGICPEETELACHPTGLGIVPGSTSNQALEQPY